MLYGIGELPEIVTLPKGKPVFSDKNLPSFSISYAGNMVGVALTTEGECGLDMELQRATRGFHSPHAPDNHTFSSNESLWISKQNDPNEARAQLITLRRSVLKLTGDVLNDDPRDLQLLPHCRTPEMCSCKSCRSVMRRGRRAGVVRGGHDHD